MFHLSSARNLRSWRATGLLAVVVFAILASGCMSAEARTFFDRTNALRGASGVAPLGEHDALDAKAEQWAAHMAATGTLAHSNLAHGLEGVSWTLLGENVGVSRPTSDTLRTIHDAFAASPEHHGNMVNGEFTHMGVGVATGADGRVWVAEVFGRI